MKSIFMFIKRAGNLGLIIFLITVTFIYAMFQGGFVSWFLFYSFLPVGLYSFLIAVYPISSMDVKRLTNQTEYSAGEKLVGTITINRKFPLPLVYMVVEEVLPSELKYHEKGQKSKVLLFPWFKRNLTFNYVFDSIPRGEHLFTEIRVRTGDLFGLVEKQAVFPIEQKFLVYPKCYDLIYRQVESRFEQGATASNVNLQRDTTIAIGIRDYKPGDRFSWIDWKSSARKNEIMTKEFEQQQSHDVVLFLDRTPSREFEQSVTFLTSLVRSILKKGAQLSLISIGEEQSIFPLRGGETQQQQIFYHLAKVKSDSSVPFSITIDSEMKKIYQGITFMFVTSRLTSDFVRALERLSFRRANLLVFVAKEKGAQLLQLEIGLIETLRRRSVVVKVVYEGHYTDVFLEVSNS
ncbi:DUF58 domain-containing protein [Litchfieldia salsa]|uniref:Uncharacterized conserved protein, DUF58 family, contains vWF domain n=1 Tax=Litchfieldia salsa TaxID=930152 RepID=A0A1H0WSD7_9BACI|nr:DUF58 domain-containing protein [Litchfieldia salsa]SDP93502.1 Uncharacterized conserved protein, DUF58 family, contains vWF domain [Litchfieldia salsa]